MVYYWLLVNNSVLIQFGHARAGTGGNIYLPISFSNAIYSIAVCCLQNTTNWPICWTPNLYASYIIMDGSGNVWGSDRGMLCSWIAIGY